MDPSCIVEAVVLGNAGSLGILKGTKDFSAGRVSQSSSSIEGTASGSGGLRNEHVYQEAYCRDSNHRHSMVHQADNHQSLLLKNSSSCSNDVNGGAAGSPNFQCPQCPFKTASPVVMNRHKQNIHVTVPHSTHFCPDCLYRSAIKLQVKQHRKFHQTKSFFQCLLCTFSASTKTSITLHMKRDHHQDDNSNCQCRSCNLVVTAHKRSLNPSPDDHKNETKKTKKRSESKRRRSFSSIDSFDSDSMESTNDDQDFEKQNPNEIYVREKKGGSTKKDGPPENLSLQQVYVCPNENCDYWARAICIFHEHILSVHQDAPAYKCSRCDYQSKHRYYVYNHIKSMKEKTGGNHSEARVVFPGYPEDLYVHVMKALMVPVSKDRGRLSLIPSSSGSNKPPAVTSNTNEQDGPMLSGLPVPDGSPKSLPGTPSLIDQNKVFNEALDALKEEKFNFEYLLAEDEVARKQLAQLNQDIQMGDRLLNEAEGSNALMVSEEHGRVLALRNKKDGMQEKERQAFAEVSSLKKTKKELDDQSSALAYRKMRVEAALRKLQCDELNLKLAAHESKLSQELVESLADATEKVRLHEIEVEKIELEIQTVNQRERDLSQSIEEAEESRDSLTSQLDTIREDLSAIEAAASSRHLDELKSHQRIRILACGELKERLLRIEHLVGTANVRKETLDRLDRLDLL